MKKSILILISLIVLLTGFSSCDIMGIGNPLIGQWTRTTTSFVYHTMTFTDDRVNLRIPSEGTILSGTYERGDNYLFIQWDEGGGGTFAYNMTDNNRKLSITWAGGDVCAYSKSN